MNSILTSNINMTNTPTITIKKRQRNYDFTSKALLLPADFTPNESTDILCGRGNFAVNHPANIVFNEIVRSSLQDYANAKRRVDKSMVVASVLKELTEDAGTRFVKRQGKQWYEMTTEQAHDKIGHCIRDMIRQETKENHMNQSSSSMSKQAMREQKQQQQQFQDIYRLVLQNAAAEEAIA